MRNNPIIRNSAPPVLLVYALVLNPKDQSPDWKVGYRSARPSKWLLIRKLKNYDMPSRVEYPSGNESTEIHSIELLSTFATWIRAGSSGSSLFATLYWLRGERRRYPSWKFWKNYLYLLSWQTYSLTDDHFLVIIDHSWSIYHVRGLFPVGEGWNRAGF